MTRPCPSCGQPTTGPPDRTLDAAPHRLGIWAPDGQKLTSRDIRAGAEGHHIHICATRAAKATTPADDQLALDI